MSRTLKTKLSALLLFAAIPMLSSAQSSIILRLNQYFQLTITSNQQECTLFRYSLKQGEFPESCPSAVEIPGNFELTTLTGDNAIYNGSYSLTSINDRAFQYDISQSTMEYDRQTLIQSIESITIPSTVKTMGNEVFSGCSGLKSAVLPESITTMGHSLFAECTSLTNATVKSQLSTKAIPNTMFKNCTALTEVSFESDMTFIGFETFSGCTSLTTLRFSGSRISAADDAFTGVDMTKVTAYVPYGTSANYSTLSNLGATIVEEADPNAHAVGDVLAHNNLKYTVTSTEPLEVATTRNATPTTTQTAINIPSGFEDEHGHQFAVTGIGAYGFDHCMHIPAITLPEGLDYIGESAFTYCQSVTSLTIPSTVTRIEQCAFDHMTGLTSLVIPESVTELGAGAIYNCPNLETVTINANITQLNRMMFQGNTALQQVILPPTLTSIDSNAFNGCASLTELVFTGTALTDIAEDAFAGMDLSNVIISIPDESSLSNYEFFKDKVKFIADAEGNVIYGTNPDAPVLEPEAITEIPTESDNGKLYILMTRRGGLYAETDVHKLGSFGLANCGSGRDNMEMDASDSNQLFAILKYESDFYFYSVSDNRFFSFSGNTPTLDENPVNPMTIVAGSSGNINGYLLSFADGNCHLNITGWQHYHGAKVVSCTPDEGNIFTVYDTHKTLTDEQLANAMVRIKKKAYLAFATEHEGEIGYPDATALEAYRDALNSADLTEEIMETAKSNLLATSDVNLPEDGKAYALKARYTNGTYRYVTYNGTRLHITNTKPTDGSDIFVVKSTGEDGQFALFNPAVGKFLTYYASGKRGVGNSQGFTDNYVTTDGHTADVTVHHITNNVQNVAPELLYGTLSLQCLNISDGNLFHIMAGDSDYHNGLQHQNYFTNNRSSFFEFTEVTEHPMEVAHNGANHQTLYNMATFVAPYDVVIPTGVTAYFISEVTENAAARSESAGSATVKKFCDAGMAIPANTAVILSSELAATTLQPKTTEQTASLPDGYNNLLTAVAEGDTDKHTLSGDTFVLNANPEAGSVYLSVPETHTVATYNLNANDTSTSINEISAGAATNDARAIYDLQGRRVNNTQRRGLYIINGKKIFIR